jgi:hypothetical protein
MRVVPLVLAPLFLFATEASDKCPMGGVAMISPHQRQQAAYHAASTTAELVAPSTESTSSGRRRAVTAPTNPIASFPPTVNFIDSDLFAAMQQNGVVPTTIASDDEFLRRIYLDLTGQIPDSATVTAFLADKTPDKRAKKIDELLASDPFVDRWTMWFGDLVQNVTVSNNVREYYLGRNAYYAYIKDSIKNQKAYDQLVRDVITGAGDSYATGNADYVVRQLQNNGPPQDTYDNLVSHSGERFLGMTLLCLSCHNGLGHLELVNQSLKSHTRYDFWGMAAFFARTRAQGQRYTDPANPNANLIKFMVSDAANGEYQLNTTSGNKSPRAPAPGQPTSVPPVYMFTGEGPRTGEARRVAYARILTSDRQFARAAVNYLWKEMYGIGIVEPANAFDLARLDPNHLPAGQTLQPTNPKLLEDLTDNFISGGYNLRAFLRTMAMSSSYQLSSKYTPGAWNEGWTTYFPRHYPRRLSAEMMLDAIVKTTNVPATLNVQGMGAVAKAMSLPDTVEPGARNQFGLFLNEFGRGNRDDTARTNDASISEALSLLNNTIITTRVKKSTANSTVSKILATTSDPASIVDQVYLATLSRSPTTTERTTAFNYLISGNLTQRTEDLQFTLLNELEFLFY